MISIYTLKKLILFYPDYIVTMNMLFTGEIYNGYSNIITKSTIAENHLTKLTRSPIAKLN